MRYTKELRQEILDEFVSRHNEFDAAVFVEEVQQRGEAHPAYAWFEWDDTVAAREHRLWQSRSFAQGLKVKFEVHTVERSVSGVTVREADAPAFVSPLATRNDGGGYFKTDLNNEDHVDELLKQARQSLDAWLRRYGGVYEAVGGSQEDFSHIKRHLRYVDQIAVAPALDMRDVRALLS